VTFEDLHLVRVATAAGGVRPDDGRPAGDAPLLRARWTRLSGERVLERSDLSKRNAMTMTAARGKVWMFGGGVYGGRYFDSTVEVDVVDLALRRELVLARRRRGAARTGSADARTAAGARTAGGGSTELLERVFALDAALLPAILSYV
jgi:hypothetical protein